MGCGVEIYGVVTFYEKQLLPQILLMKSWYYLSYIDIFRSKFPNQQTGVQEDFALNLELDKIWVHDFIGFCDFPVFAQNFSLA